MSVAIFAVLVACASTPQFDLHDIDATITPQGAVASPGTVQGKKVLWGGVIVASRNLEKGTQLEVLAYPLDERRRPRTDREPLGRFIAEHSGYLETVDYAPGRELTLKGTFTGTKEGRIDEAAYTYPAVSAEQLHLWSKRAEDTEPRFRFGIGVMIHN